ncbi:Uric acid degradation bifunctional protein TTL [Arachis hypogaea]|nr:Uric acid degradation bifunctional protein TTL [Arachis hypogaea]
MVHLYTSLLEFAAAHGGNVTIAGKLEERDFFLCGTSIWFSKAMVQASPFSSLEHATSFARDLWFNKSPIQSWLDVFSAHLHIDRATKFAPGPIMTLYKLDTSFESLNTAGVGAIQKKVPQKIRLYVYN